MHNHKLLVICCSYTAFQKDPTDLVAPIFQNVSVLVRHNPIAEISKYIPIPELKYFCLDYNIDFYNKPSNLEVYTTPILYAPFDSQYKVLGDKHLKSVEKVIEENNIEFDLIHSHFTWPCGYVGAKLKEKYNVPLVITAHGFDIYKLPFKDLDWQRKIQYVLSSADYIITVSKNNSDYIKKLNVDTPVKILPNGYKDDLFYPMNQLQCKRKLNLPLNNKIILNVGNLSEVKGHKYLIEAMKEIVKFRKDVLCIIIGEGKLRNTLQRQINNNGLSKFIKLVGRRPHSEIPIWINACDLFVLPSLNEGNPTVMFECLGCGKPFIGTNVGGVPEIIKSNDHGLLTDAGNSHKLAEKIKTALDKKWDGKKIVNYAEKYKWKNIAEEIQQIYCHLLQN